MSTTMKFEFLPNEIFNECFQYLNGPDVFYSFDRLNYRLYSVIRNSPLHLNFEQLKKFQFNDFCQTILSNPEIKQNIISLQLSNIGTCGQIHSFLSLFPLNEFTSLRSLLLIDIAYDNIQQILPMLPFLSNLYQLSCPSIEYQCLEIMPVLLKSKIRILAVRSLHFNSALSYGTVSLTSLTIGTCTLSKLCQLFKYTPMLKSLKTKGFYDSPITSNELDLTNANVFHLKELIMNYCQAKFQALELLLKRTPNLKIFSISSLRDMEMLDADHWQHLIETSLSHLHVFKFHFCFAAHDFSNEMLIKLRKFQTDFWHKQHHWYTNYEINGLATSIYTIPYICSIYRLQHTTKRYINSLMSNSNEFNNVKNLDIEPRAIRNDSLFYFKNVQSLTLTHELDDDEKTHEYDLSSTQIKFLNTIVNVSNIKHLSIEDDCHISSSLLSKLLKKMPNVSSLRIKKQTLVSFLENGELCKCLNKNILTLDIYTDYINRYITSNQTDLLCKTFSNVEQLHCNCDIENVDNLLLIFKKLSKLSMIKFGMISKQIYAWIQINASTLNVYINFTYINKGYNDDM